MPRYVALSHNIPRLQALDDGGQVGRSPHMRLDARTSRQGLEPRALRRRQAADIATDVGVSVGGAGVPAAAGVAVGKGRRQHQAHTERH